MDSPKDCNKSWDIETAKSHYRIKNWGLQYFDINAEGHLEASTGNAKIDLYKLSKELKENNISLPVLVIDYFHKQNKRPIAFEVGSKAELICCLGISEEKQTIICNGYKDQGYIRLALMGCLLGHDVIIVIENSSEVEHIASQSEELGVEPKLGMRIRLSSIAKGNWQNTGGENSKFGLVANESLTLLALLQEKNILPCMKMLHFHMGSQIPALDDIKAGITEGVHYFSELSKLGVRFEYLNVGGGLAVDYEGSGSENYFSMNYSVHAYAAVIIQAVSACCKNFNLGAPTIISENGRAMTAHHAVLITNVIDAEYQSDDLQQPLYDQAREGSNHSSFTSLLSCIKKVEKKSNSASDLLKLHDEIHIITVAIEQEFSMGKLSLIEKAEFDKMAKCAFWKILNSDALAAAGEHEEVLQSIAEKFVAKYFCNFSLFQSTPDIWGLRQIFPIVPLHRLDECPSVKSRIYDLTCDSDGRIDDYVEADSIQPYLSLHKIAKQQEYILGIFLVGAYQEILGDMHNLFGDTNAVNIRVDRGGSYEICDAEPGDTVAEILSYLHIDAGRMRQNWMQRLSSVAVPETKAKLVLNEFMRSLDENSYLI